MSAQIDSSPDLIRPDNQPLIFTISDTGSAPDRYVVQVEEDSVEIAKLYLTPNSNDVVHFDLSEVVRDRVKVDDKIRDESAVLHSYSAKAYTTGRNGLKKYEVKVGTYTGTTETTNQDSDVVYLVDGSEQISDGLLPTFADYYPLYSTRKSWLTDRQEKDGEIRINASEEDEGVVGILNDSLIIPSSPHAILYVLYNGASAVGSQSFIFNTTNGAQEHDALDNNQKLTYMGMMPKNIDGYVTLSPLDNPWTHYKLVVYQSAVVGSMDLMVYKDCRPFKHNPTQLAWTNTRGGWDYLRFDGRAMKTITTSTKTYKKAIGNWDATTYTFLDSARDSQPYQITGVQSYELTSVNFDVDELALMQYALRSDNVMIRVGTGDWIPVNIDTKSYKVETLISRVTQVSLKVTQAQVIKC